MSRERVVARLLNGSIMKGYIDNFSQYDDMVVIEDEEPQSHEFRIEEVKALFFVKTFEGDKAHKDKKSFMGTSYTGKRAYIKFKDGESVMGYIEGDVPWQKGFFLESKRGKGFFLKPVDIEGNNIKIFVVGTSVADLTVMG